MSRTKVVTVNELKKNEKSSHGEDDVDTDTFYIGMIDQMKTMIEMQNEDIDQKNQKIRIVERAFELNNREKKKEIDSKMIDIRNRDTELSLLKKELEHHRAKETDRTGKRADVRKMVQDIHLINSKKREKKISDADLDKEAMEYVKKFAL